MTEARSYNILLLGLKDGSQPGRARYANAMERLTGRSAREFSAPSRRSDDPVFLNLDRDTARVVANVLGEAGALIEVRPTGEIPMAASEQVVATQACPRCRFVQPAESVECAKCGLVFAKFEREQVQEMQKSKGLEEALTRALQSRDEWSQKAGAYLETHPLKEGSVDGFESALLRDEVPFLRLRAEEGPILMTSRRLISSLEGGFFFIPYEMVSDVTMGGGLVQKKNWVRLQLTFHAPIPTPTGATKQATWMLDKDSSFFKDVIMDWCFARIFICGGCGQRELDFRLEGSKPKARCMHCATDHEIDLREAIAIPLAPPA